MTLTLTETPTCSATLWNLLKLKLNNIWNHAQTHSQHYACRKQSNNGLKTNYYASVVDVQFRRCARNVRDLDKKRSRKHVKSLHLISLSTFPAHAAHCNCAKGITKDNTALKCHVAHGARCKCTQIYVKSNCGKCNRESVAQHVKP